MPTDGGAGWPLGGLDSARVELTRAIEDTGGLVIEGVTIGAGASGYCFRVRGRFRGFCDQGGGVEGRAKAGMRLVLMAHFALVVRKRSRHRVHSLVDKNHNRYRL